MIIVEVETPPVQCRTPSIIRGICLNDKCLVVIRIVQGAALNDSLFDVCKSLKLSFGPDVAPVICCCCMLYKAIARTE